MKILHYVCMLCICIYSHLYIFFKNLALAIQTQYLCADVTVFYSTNKRQEKKQCFITEKVWMKIIQICNCVIATVNTLIFSLLLITNAQSFVAGGQQRLH